MLLDLFLVFWDYFWALQGHFGLLLGALWVALGSLLGAPGPVLDALGALRGALGALWVALGTLWGAPGRSWLVSQRILEHFLVLLATIWAALEALLPHLRASKRLRLRHLRPTRWQTTAISSMLRLHMLS